MIGRHSLKFKILNYLLTTQRPPLAVELFVVPLTSRDGLFGSVLSRRDRLRCPKPRCATLLHDPTAGISSARRGSRRLEGGLADCWRSPTICPLACCRVDQGFCRLQRWPSSPRGLFRCLWYVRGLVVCSIYYLWPAASCTMTREAVKLTSADSICAVIAG